MAPEELTQTPLVWLLSMWVCGVCVFLQRKADPRDSSHPVQLQLCWWLSPCPPAGVWSHPWATAAPCNRDPAGKLRVHTHTHTERVSHSLGHSNSHSNTWSLSGGISIHPFSYRYWNALQFEPENLARRIYFTLGSSELSSMRNSCNTHNERSFWEWFHRDCDSPRRDDSFGVVKDSILND